jgi:hypothetical protein
MVKVSLIELDPTFFPLSQPVKAKCGLRTDLPKKARRHVWARLGRDVRNAGSEGFKEYEILACMICGSDRKVAPDALSFIG